MIDILISFSYPSLMLSIYFSNYSKMQIVKMFLRKESTLWYSRTSAVFFFHIFITTYMLYCNYAIIKTTDHYYHEKVIFWNSSKSNFFFLFSRYFTSIEEAIWKDLVVNAKRTEYNKPFTSNLLVEWYYHYYLHGKGIALVVLQDMLC